MCFILNRINLPPRGTLEWEQYGRHIKGSFQTKMLNVNQTSFHIYLKHEINMNEWTSEHI